MAAKKPISQSDTRWVKRDGKGGGGYVEQISTGKKVSGKVNLVADSTKGKAGETRSYKAGRDVTGSKPDASGGGQMPSNSKPKVAKSSSGPSGGSSATAKVSASRSGGSSSRPASAKTPSKTSTGKPSKADVLNAFGVGDKGKKPAVKRGSVPKSPWKTPPRNRPTPGKSSLQAQAATYLGPNSAAAKALNMAGRLSATKKKPGSGSATAGTSSSSSQTRPRTGGEVAGKSNKKSSSGPVVKRTGGGRPRYPGARDK